jgi:hypothetical protein
MGTIMNFFTTRGPAQISEELVDEIENKVRVLPREPVRLPELDGKVGERSVENLNGLLGKVSESSTREIDRLIDELQVLRGKLQADTDRIQRDVREYAVVSAQVMQLTKIISESVQKLPDSPSIIP